MKELQNKDNAKPLFELATHHGAIRTPDYTQFFIQ